MIHGFLKACTVSPALRVADCAFNTQQTIRRTRKYSFFRRKML